MKPELDRAPSVIKKLFGFEAACMRTVPFTQSTGKPDDSQDKSTVPPMLNTCPAAGLVNASLKSVGGTIVKLFVEKLPTSISLLSTAAK